MIIFFWYLIDREDFSECDKCMEVTWAIPVTDIGTPWRVYTLSLFTFSVRVFKEILQNKEKKTVTSSQCLSVRSCTRLDGDEGSRVSDIDQHIRDTASKMPVERSDAPL